MNTWILALKAFVECKTREECEVIHIDKRPDSEYLATLPASHIMVWDRKNGRYQLLAPYICTYVTIDQCTGSTHIKTVPVKPAHYIPDVEQLRRFAYHVGYRNRPLMTR